MKLEWPMFTSTWPLELFRPMTMRFCRIRYSSSRPSSLAITPVTSWSGAHCTLVGLPGIDLSACSVQSGSDMAANVACAHHAQRANEQTIGEKNSQDKRDGRYVDTDGRALATPMTNARRRSSVRATKPDERTDDASGSSPWSGDGFGFFYLSITNRACRRKHRYRTPVDGFLGRADGERRRRRRRKNTRVRVRTNVCVCVRVFM